MVISKGDSPQRLTSGTKWPSSGCILLGCSHTCKWAGANNEIFRSSIIRFFPSLGGGTAEADRLSTETSSSCLDFSGETSVYADKPPPTTQWPPPTPLPTPSYFLSLHIIEGRIWAEGEKKLWDLICFLIGCSEMVPVFGWQCEMISVYFVCVRVTLSDDIFRRNFTIVQVCGWAAVERTECKEEEKCRDADWKGDAAIGIEKVYFNSTTIRL